MIIKKRHKQAEIIQQPAVQQILDTPLQAPNDVVVPKTESVEIKKEKLKTELDTIGEFEKIDISEIEFKERVERRRLPCVSSGWDARLFSRQCFIKRPRFLENGFLKR